MSPPGSPGRVTSPHAKQGIHRTVLLILILYIVSYQSCVYNTNLRSQDSAQAIVYTLPYYWAAGASRRLSTCSECSRCLLVPQRARLGSGKLSDGCPPAKVSALGFSCAQPEAKACVGSTMRFTSRPVASAANAHVAP